MPGIVFSVLLIMEGVKAGTLLNSGVHERFQSIYLHGISLFNAAHFFEAHEVLEDVWRDAPEPERKFLQGLIQVAVAFVHYSRGNQIGCRSVLQRARRNLSAYPKEHGGLDLASLRDSLEQWCVAIDRDLPMPPLPRFETP
jgi:uncharacterized protein